jgi:hypothetical protein
MKLILEFNMFIKFVPKSVLLSHEDLKIPKLFFNQALPSAMTSCQKLGAYIG